MGQISPAGGCIIKVERPRAARYSFVASVEVTDLESGHKSKQITNDISLYGCRIIPGNSLLPGARVRLQIVCKGEVFHALGRVTHVRPIAGMGIVFTNVDPRDELLLEKWIAQEREKKLQSQQV